MSPEDYEILCNAMNGGKPPDHAVRLLEDTCTRTGLDWKLRHAYLMQRGGKWMVTLSIDGFRLIGSQDPEYAGQEGPLWVPATPDGKPGTEWTDIPPDGPIYAAKVGIKHRNGTTTWGVAKYKDYEAGPMWKKFPSTMSAKCAEMLAWRKAMPGRLGGLYGVEEMAQAAAPKAAPPPPAISDGDADALKNTYMLRLEGARSKDELSVVGNAIKDDKTLSMQQILQLHHEFTRRKKALGVD